MTDTSTPPEWPAKGETVAVYTSSAARTHIILIPVSRRTDTQIVLEDGTKFRRSDHWQVGGTAQLRPADDPTVQNYFARKTTDTVGYDLARLFEEYRNTLSADRDDAAGVLRRAEELIASAQADLGIASRCADPDFCASDGDCRADTTKEN